MAAGPGIGHNRRRDGRKCAIVFDFDTEILKQEGIVDAVRCARVVQRMAETFPWFMPAVREIRMLRIEGNNDLKSALTDEDD